MEGRLLPVFTPVRTAEEARGSIASKEVAIVETVRVAIGPERIGVLALLTLTAGCAGPPERESGAEGGATGAAATADSVVGAWIEAAGGLQAWDEVRRARYTVTTLWYDSAGRVERMRPRRVELRKTSRGEESRIERPEAEGLYVQTFTGDTAWATLNGYPLAADHPAAEEAEYVGRDVFYWFGLPYKLRDPGVNLEARSLEGGGHEVRVTFGEDVGAHPGDRYFYLFLDGDPYPEEVHYIEEGRGPEDRSETRWSEFRDAGPLTYVGVREWTDDAGRLTKALWIDDVVIDPALADSLFEPPCLRDPPGLGCPAAGGSGSSDTARATGPGVG